ncbi:MAG: acyltransferase, partial [Gammaproteobacteria bacterium]|nr:acyltransferase [Gammaproteobacteria bacterium]
MRQPGIPRAPEARPYRADIDGLRAVAVVAVVLFHALPEQLPGGFVGVDVFFVISGYLITGLLTAHLRADRFSFADFYARRIRRLFPALATVLAATWALGYALLFADEFARLGRHLAGGATFLSNALLYTESGYFDTASADKPLLHLWSLAIEEQFYLLWPALLWWATRRAWPLPRCIGGLCLLSFVANLLCVASSPALAFYAPWTRGWELFAGAWLACADESALTARQREFCAWGGALLLAAAFALCREFHPYPGWRACLPVGGALLLLAAGPTASVNRRALARFGLPWVGLVSYPLYLWHWPLLVYGRALGHGALPPAPALALAGAATFLAWVTWRWIETPLRGARGVAPVGALVAALALLGALGLGTQFAHGLPARASALASRANAAQLGWEPYASAECLAELGFTVSFCRRYGGALPVRALVWGDSTANALAPGLGEALKARGAGVLNLGSYSCPPLPGVAVRAARRGPHCREVNEHALAYALRSPEVELVVLSWAARYLDFWDVPGQGPFATRAARHE